MAEPGAVVQVVPVRERAPGVGEVRVDVQASGICGADIGTVRNPAPATGFPVTPGHEVAGVIAALGPRCALARIDFGPDLAPELVRLARTTPVWMGAVAKVVARCRTAFWRDAGLAGAAVSRTGPLQELHDMSGPDGRPAALFGFAAAQAVGADFAQAATAQLARLFGPAAAEPVALHIQDWSGERWTAPPAVRRPADCSLFGHPLYRRPALGGRLHWASTETADSTPGTSRAPSPRPSER